MDRHALWCSLICLLSVGVTVNAWLLVLPLGGLVQWAFSLRVAVLPSQLPARTQSRWWSLQ